MHKAYTLTKDIECKARLLALAGDTTRARIFCFMFENKEACVSQIADSLGMSVASISHHLQMMKDHDLFQTERNGNTICDKLIDSQFTHQLKSMLCA